jgi:hypothetical protein
MAAVACTFASINVCNYVQLGGLNYGSYSRSIWRGQLTSFDSCASYKGSYIYIDRAWYISRAFSVVAQIFAGLALFSTLAALKPNKGTLSIAASFSLIACLFVGLTLLFLRSSVCDVYFPGVQGPAITCSMDQGAKLAIAATVLWFVAGVSMICSGAALE